MVVKYIVYCVGFDYLFIYLFIYFSSWQSLHNDNGHVKKEITMKVRKGKGKVTSLQARCGPEAG